jgi:hypothetical protein
MIATKCRPGRCTRPDCGKVIWRTATARRNMGRSIKAGMTTILWPDPSSVYARLETPTGYAPGVAFCAEHEPAIGDTVLDGYGPVIQIDSAHDRYGAWFTAEWGFARRLWLRDAFSYTPQEVDQLMAQWEADRPLIVL